MSYAVLELAAQPSPFRRWRRKNASCSASRPRSAGPAAQLGIQMNIGAQGCTSIALNAQRRRQRPPDRAAHASTTATSRTRCEANTRQADRGGACSRCSATSARRPCLAALPLVNEAQGAVLRAVHRRRSSCASRSTATSSTCARRTTTRPSEIVEAADHARAATRSRSSTRTTRYGKAGLDGVTRALKQLNMAPIGARHGRAQHGRRRAGGEGHRARTQPDAVVQISAYKSCAAFIRECTQGRLRRRVLQRLVRRHARRSPTRAGRRRSAASWSAQVMPFPFSPHDAVSSARVPRSRSASASSGVKEHELSRAWKASSGGEGVHRRPAARRPQPVSARAPDRRARERCQHADLGGFARQLRADASTPRRASSTCPCSPKTEKCAADAAAPADRASSGRTPRVERNSTRKRPRP